MDSAKLRDMWDKSQNLLVKGTRELLPNVHLLPSFL